MKFSNYYFLLFFIVFIVFIYFYKKNQNNNIFLSNISYIFIWYGFWNLLDYIFNLLNINNNQYHILYNFILIFIGLFLLPN
jgi:hypothetical protein